MSPSALPLAFYDTNPTGGIGGRTDGGRLPLVLGHGFALDHTLWAPQVEALRDQRRILRFDMPGHGSSSAPAPFDLWQVAEAVLAHLDAHKLDRFVVGGLSQGGFVALRMALLAPERVTGLVLADTESHACSTAEAHEYRTLFEHLAQVGTDPAHTGGLAAQILGAGPMAARWQQHWATHGLPAGHPVEALVNRDGLDERLGEITAPALLLRGADDLAIPAERMDYLAEHLPAAGPVNTIDGAAHAPPLTHPDQVNELLAAFCAELDAS